MFFSLVPENTKWAICKKLNENPYLLKILIVLFSIKFYFRLGMELKGTWVDVVWVSEEREYASNTFHF